MKAYKLNITVYDFWYDMDRDGWNHEEKFFSSKEKVEKWIAEHSRYAHERDSEIAKNDWHLPKYEIEEIEIE